MRIRTIGLVLWIAVGVFAAGVFAAGARGEETPGGVIRLDETVISGNQELPKVLYILPWRAPRGLPEVDLTARYSEMDVFRRLYPPAYRRELTYFESLEAEPNRAKSSEE